MNKRAIELSIKHKLSHVGSVLTTIPILEEIYQQRRFTDAVVLSNGHAGLALYCANEKYYGIDAEETLLKHGVHPVRDPERMIDVSTGSLGQGITVALGIALSGRETHCVISDGECAEGSVWETLRIKDDLKVDNLHVHVNANGFGAYKTIDIDKLEQRLKAFTDVKIHRTHTKGLEDHYRIADETWLQR